MSSSPDETEIISQNPPSILLAMNCRDEANIREWVLYHSTLGLQPTDGILIFDDMSQTPVQNHLHEWKWFPSLLPNITIQRTHKGKFEYMRMALSFAKENRFDWLLYIDADEYIVVGSQYHDNLRDFIQKNIDENDSGPLAAIGLFWKHFGSSNLDHNPTNGNQCLAIFHKCASQITPTLKVITNVPLTTGPLSPHHYSYLSTIKKSKIIYCPFMKTFLPNLPKQHNDPKFIAIMLKALAEREQEGTDHEFIAHYSIQSWKEYCFRRNRPRDDNGLTRKPLYENLDPSSKPPDSFHLHYNEAIDRLPHRTFLRNLKRFLESIKNKKN